jgi:uncharacterized protein DUF4153
MAVLRHPVPVEIDAKPVPSAWGAVPVAERQEPLDVRVAVRLLAAAVAVGLAGQLLFYGQRMGLNVLLGGAALLAAARLVRRPEARMDRWDLWLPPAALAFAAFIAIRADPALVAFDVLAALGLTGASMAAIAGIPVTRRSLGAVTMLALSLAASALGGIFRLSPALSMGSMLTSGLRGTVARTAILGLLIALPFLIVFVALFASADPVFARLVQLGFRFDIPLGDLPARVVVAAIITWIAGGLLVFVGGRPAEETTGAVAEAADPPAGPADPSAPEVAPATTVRVLDAAVASVALVAIDLLFLLFVILQAAYLFGGRDTLGDIGLTYSEYARRGFFELIAAAVVAGGLVLLLEALIRSRSRAYLAAAVTLCALTGVILLSATVRLSLYQQAYGWTELRFYALAAICWLAICVVAAITAILADRTRWVLHAIGFGALAVALVVNAIGPQAYVASANVDRALHPELVPADGEAALDADYLGLLGPDAVPALAQALPHLPRAERDRVARELAALRAELRYDVTAGWPSFNLAREQARQILAGSDLSYR